MTTFRQAPTLFTLIGINVFIFLAQNLGWDLRQQGALMLNFPTLMDFFIAKVFGDGKFGNVFDVVTLH